MTNERIKELIEQCTIEEHDGFRFFDKAKFAELIVKECLNINRARLFDNYQDNDIRIAHNNALWCATNDIQKHFGVD